MKTQITTRDLVLEFISALNTENFDVAGKWLNEDFTFNGPMGKRDNAASYMQDMEKMKLKYNVVKTFEEANCVCIVYDITMNDKVINACGIYCVDMGKLSSLKVFFDPRPLL